MDKVIIYRSLITLLENLQGTFSIDQVKIYLSGFITYKYLSDKYIQLLEEYGMNQEDLAIMEKMPEILSESTKRKVKKPEDQLKYSLSSKSLYNYVCDCSNCLVDYEKLVEALKNFKVRNTFAYKSQMIEFTKSILLLKDDKDRQERLVFFIVAIQNMDILEPLGEFLILYQQMVEECFFDLQKIDRSTGKRKDTCEEKQPMEVFILRNYSEDKGLLKVLKNLQCGSSSWIKHLLELNFTNFNSESTSSHINFSHLADRVCKNLNHRLVKNKIYINKALESGFSHELGDVEEKRIYIYDPQNKKNRVNYLADVPLTIAGITIYFKKIFFINSLPIIFWVKSKGQVETSYDDFLSFIDQSHMLFLFSKLIIFETDQSYLLGTIFQDIDEYASLNKNIDDDVLYDLLEEKSLVNLISINTKIRPEIDNMKASDVEDLSKEDYEDLEKSSDEVGNKLSETEFFKGQTEDSQEDPDIGKGGKEPLQDITDKELEYLDFLDSNEEDDDESLDDYLNSEEFTKAYESWQELPDFRNNKEYIRNIQETGAEVDWERLVQANEHLVVKRALKLLKGPFGRTVEMDDLIQWGRIGILKAAEKFDFSQNTEFSTYAYYWIFQQMLRGIYDTGNTIRVPVHMCDSIYKLAIIEKNSEKLFQEVDDEWICQEMKINMDKLKDLRRIRYQFFNIPSLDLPIGEDADTSLGDYIEDPVEPFEEEVCRTDLNKYLLETIENLPERTAFVLKKRFGLEGQEPNTLEEVGEELGVTRERVRQIEKKALEKLKKNKILKEILNDWT